MNIVTHIYGIVILNAPEKEATRMIAGGRAHEATEEEIAKAAQVVDYKAALDEGSFCKLP